VTCPEDFIINEECKCICALNETICKMHEGKFNEKFCDCEYPSSNILWVCDHMSSPCPPGMRKITYPVCKCETINCPEIEPCKSNHAFNESCICDCSLTQESCDETMPGSTVGFDKCECIEPKALTNCDKECGPNHNLNVEECKCYCSLDEVSCMTAGYSSKVNEDSCTCERTSCLACPNGNYKRVEGSCECICDVDAENNCQLGETFSKDECQCKGQNFPKVID
jgi:hypothetical protein